MDNKETVECRLCGKSFKQISKFHLIKEHGITIAEYREQFPEAKLRIITPNSLNAIHSLEIRTIQKNNRDNKKENKKKKYLENPKYCPQCSKIIPYDIRGNKFCSASCAGIYNNQQWSEESKQKRLEILALANSKKIKKVKVEIKRDPNLVPLVKIAIRKYTAQFLEKDPEKISWDDVSIFTTYLKKLYYDEKLSSDQIKDKLNIKHSSFRCFLKSLGIKLRTLSQATKNYNKKTGKENTDEKSIYCSKCAFRFNPDNFPDIPGYNLLHIYSSNKGTNGVHRDHMVSISFGWENNIDPEIINHPANCAIIPGRDNIVKGKKCSMTLDELLSRIQIWNEKYSHLLR